MNNSVNIKNKIQPFRKSIKISGDKSLSIRCVLLASQAIGISKIKNLLESEDVLNTLKAIRSLGIKYLKRGQIYEIRGYGINGYKIKNKLIINAGNSGTLARLLTGLLVNIDSEIKIIGDKSLSKRDFKRVTEPLKLFGVNIKSTKGHLPLYIKGTKFLRPINYNENRGSAQCKSAVMLAGLKTPGITKIKAKKSRNHTEILFKNLKIPLKIKSGKKIDQISINGPNNFKSFNYEIPGDISSSAFFIVLTILSQRSKIIINNVNINESRIGIIKILNKMNCKIKLANKRLYKGEKIADIIVKSSNKIKSINCPPSLNSAAIDEFLVIFLVAAKAKGVSSFRSLGELNKKESPRLKIAVKFLKMIGIKVLNSGDNIKIYGNPRLFLTGNYVLKNYMKDHRVFMMSCVAALTFGGKWKINDKDSIKTSFPEFLKILRELGANIN